MRNIFKFLGVAIFAFLMSGVLEACSKDKNDEPDPIPTPTPSVTNPLVGTWKGRDSDGDPWTLRLNSDNSGSITLVYNTRASITVEERFNWTTSESSNSTKYLDIIHVSGDYILMDSDESSTSFTYIVAGNTLSLGGLTFTKSN